MQLIRELPRRDFLAIVASLGGVTLLAWLYLWNMAGDMSMPSGMDSMQIRVWDTDYFLMMYLMWAIMMVGMMLPSVTPTVLIFAAVARKSIAQGTPAPPISIFVSGYIFMWAAFSLLATLAQWGLDRAALLSPMMVSNSVTLGATLLIAAGVYQLLPIKNRCLDQCRSPMEFIANHWSTGALGAWRMGVAHGAFCLGCCWVLMLLLFVGGVMNLLWIAMISIFVLLEKVLIMGDLGGRVAGIVMITFGAILAVVGA